MPLFDGADIAVTIDSEGDTFDMTGIDMTAAKYASALIDTAGGVLDGAKAYNDAVYDPPVLFAANSFSYTAHNMSDGDIIRLRAGDANGSLSEDTDYYVEKTGADTFKLYLLADWDTTTNTATGSAIDVTVDDADLDLNIYSDRVHITTATGASDALAAVKDAISQVAQDRAALGAVQSRLNFTNEQLSVTKENLSSAISRIADVDVAEEATQYARYQILVQSGTAMLQQANQLPNAALQLLRG